MPSDPDPIGQLKEGERVFLDRLPGNYALVYGTNAHVTARLRPDDKWEIVIKQPDGPIRVLLCTIHAVQTL